LAVAAAAVLQQASSVQPLTAAVAVVGILLGQELLVQQIKAVAVVVYQHRILPVQAVTGVVALVAQAQSTYSVKV
jgi:xanthosine utilization system XapX-like protein